MINMTRLAHGYAWLSVAAKAFVLFALVLGSAGCPNWVRQAQSQTANSVAAAANAALPTLVEAYCQEGLRVIDEVKEKGGSAAEARVATAAVQEKWKPIWEAWAELRIAEDAWADALEKGSDTTAALAGLRSAYCGFMARWPGTIPVVPLAPIICGAVS